MFFTFLNETHLGHLEITRILKYWFLFLLLLLLLLFLFLLFLPQKFCWIFNEFNMLFIINISTPPQILPQCTPTSKFQDLYVHFKKMICYPKICDAHIHKGVKLPIRQAWLSIRSCILKKFPFSEAINSPHHLNLV